MEEKKKGAGEAPHSPTSASHFCCYSGFLQAEIYPVRDIFFFFSLCCSFRNRRVRMHKPELKTLSLHCLPPDEFILPRQKEQKIFSRLTKIIYIFFYSKKKFKSWKPADRLRIHSTSVKTQPHQTPSTLVCKSTLRPN